MKSGKGNFLEAEKHYKRAIKFEPNESVWHHNYALFLDEVKNDTKKAKYHYSRAIKLAPNDEEFRNDYDGFVKRNSGAFS